MAAAPPRHPVALGLLWSALGAAFAAGYLIPYKAATTAVGPAGLVLPMLLVAAALSTIIDGLWWLAQGRARGGPRGAPSPSGRATILVALVLGAASALGNEAACQALRWLEPGVASVTLRTQVLFVALGGALLLRERLGPRFWAGAALALTGYAVLQGALRGGATLAWPGVLWALTAAASFGVMQLAVRAAVFRIDVLRVNALRLWLAAALVALLPGRVAALSTVPATIWGLAALAALCGPVLSRLCLMRALRYLPAAHATLALLLGPVFAYALAGAVFGTWPGWVEILGALVILVAVALPVSELSRGVLGGGAPGDGAKPGAA